MISDRLLFEEERRELLKEFSPPVGGSNNTILDPRLRGDDRKKEDDRIENG